MNNIKNGVDRFINEYENVIILHTKGHIDDVMDFIDEPLQISEPYYGFDMNYDGDELLDVYY